MGDNLKDYLRGCRTAFYESSEGFILVITNPLISELVKQVEVLTITYGYWLSGSIQLIMKEDGKSFSGAATMIKQFI